MEITLIRHPPALIPPGVCYGRLDVPLHPDAAGTLARIAAEVGAAAAIITSPARRCRAVAGMLPGTVREDARLLELDFGRWEGVAWDDVPRAELDTWARDPERFAPPGGESGGALLARVASFHAELEAHRHGLRGDLAWRAAEAARGAAGAHPARPAGTGAGARLGHANPVLSRLSTAHSTTTLVAPSTSPV